MTSVGDDSTGGTSIEQELLAMSERVSGLRSQGSKASAQELVAELETAMEELRVTAEEITVQQRHLSALLREGGHAHATVGRLLAAMPTPVLTTDPSGVVLDANPAAGRLLRVPVDRLRGKPLATYIDVEDRRIVRTMLSDAAAGSEPAPATARVTPRGDGVHPVTLVAVPAHTDGSGPEQATVRWFVDAAPQDDGRAGLALLGSFAELLTVPAEADGYSGLARRVVDIAGRALPEASDVTLTVGDPRKPDELASSSARAQAADAAQREAGQGPCLDAFLTDRIVGSDALDDDERWPQLAERIALTGISCTLGVPVRGESSVFGVLNLYATAGGHLDDPAVRDRAELFARAASSLVQDSRRIQLLREEAHHLRQALVSRPEIDQAKGILMARFGYSADDAFRHLVAVSQRRNVKLRDVAADIVAMVRKPGEARTAD